MTGRPGGPVGGPGRTPAPGDPVPGRLPPGVRVDGSGEPAVLLCAGMAEDSGAWDRLVPLLAGRHRVLRFDRPGLGTLPAGRCPPTLAGEVARIAAVVGAAGPGRVVLVAHSAAALPAEAYARLRPDRLAGLVLVDPSVAGPPPAGLAAVAAGAAWLAGVAGPGLAVLLDRTGLARRVGPWGWERAVRRLAAAPPDPAWRAAARRAYGDGAVLTAVLVEWLAHPAVAADLVELRRHVPPPALPVRVLTALGDLPGSRARRAWRSGHAALAAAFPAGRQVVLRDARHLLHRELPGEVAVAIVAVTVDTGP
ncbi:Sigma factor SigB regulation protein RsbQ [Micromonospora sp. MW-13]|uniref:alpha/beta fold hydrolase n=1 Tax=Micromonospora sp. MW-13 TaxID=2094022 RepID=UPI000E4369B9|nr:alpha/beta hydrolase [Micromonospora sp. MW-13]RGC70545.1 Sigma factor SigB regulation protein RsbQ [Micromonospora sp. MW-13]